MRDGLRTRLDRRGDPPRTLLLQNHGLVGLSETVQDVTEMMVKIAGILVGTVAGGSPRFIHEDTH